MITDSPMKPCKVAKSNHSMAKILSPCYWIPERSSSTIPSLKLRNTCEWYYMRHYLWLIFCQLFTSGLGFWKETLLSKQPRNIKTINIGMAMRKCVGVRNHIYTRNTALKNHSPKIKNERNSRCRRRVKILLEQYTHAKLFTLVRRDQLMKYRKIIP